MSNILLNSLKEFYENPYNKQKLFDIVNNTNNISLRIIDWFVTNYSKKNNTSFMIYEKNGQKMLDLNNINLNSKQFNTYYFQWIQKSKLNKLRGIKKFKHVAFVHGTSQSFDFFYAENKSKRFRCFKGDFFYHVISWKRNNSKFAYLDDGKIKKNDAVVISIPFSDNGYIHNMTNDILEQCDKLGVPVLIDLAYYNLVRELNFNINRPCISTITFSLSKGYYPLDKLRI